ncbi:DUF551 domain-containing protein [Citrobacter freundii]|nr:DUF551 domain-containing protein [Citrobacter freundii]MEB2760009.1 DUF551 domain-containing protein [Citrobacter freundii]
MTTNNHPANGPLSLDRLHQISEILSKAAAQSDGGHLGYAMADAVRVIDGAIAAHNEEPVAYMTYKGYLLHAGDPKVSEYSEPTPLYTAPQQAPVVPDELLSAMEEVLRISDRDHEAWHKARNGIAACRAAMLQAGNSPVTPDCWIPVSERMPERDVDVQVYCADKKEQMVGYMERNEKEGWFRFASLPNGGGVYCKPTHWMPLPAAPQQEVKSALEHGMQRYAGAMQKLSEGDK